MSKKRLLVVGWDSADWKVIRPLMEAGQMPMLSKLLAEGVGGNLATLEPSLSPMLWTTIATGRHAAEHGVHGFTEVRGGAVVPVSAGTRRCRAVWNILSERGLVSNVVGWFATQGERDPNVRLVSNLYAHAPAKPLAEGWPEPPAGTFFPEELGKTLTPLRLHPAELGGDVLSMFVKNVEAIDQTKDPRLAQLAMKLAETFTVHTAATHLMEAEDWDLTMVYYRAIDEICHLFMPFHPPRMEGAPEELFAHYHDVVNSAYRLHDMLLARLVDLAGPEAGVVVLSDHGFHSDHLRPRFVPGVPAGIVVWHRAHGIFAASGAGFRKGSEIYGAGLPDVAPTILRWFGVPRSWEMEGRVLRDALEEDGLLPDVATHEGETPRHEALVLEDNERKAMLKHFVDLGYIEAVPDDAGAAAMQTQRENDWQLACALLHSGRHEEALPLLEAVHDAVPGRPDFSQRLAHCQLQLGLLDEAEATIEASLAGFKDASTIALVRANIAYQRGRHEEAMGYLQELGAETPGLQEQLARTLLKLRRWDEAEAMARKILERDPTYAPSWAIIARCQLHRGEDDACIESSLEAINLAFNSPLAHVGLGIVLARKERWREAEAAFRNAIKLAPANIPPYRFLAQVLAKTGSPDEAALWMTQAKTMRQRANDEEPSRQRRVREAALERAQKRAARPKLPPPPEMEPLDLLLVSGLPRSGTSLMMRILQAGGIPLLTDGQRVADEDNPEGYWEWEEIKKLPKDPTLLKAAEGKAVKVVTPLLPSLPRAHRYKIIYMTRPITQVVASQNAMLKRLGRDPAREADHMAKMQEEHSAKILEAFRKSDRVEILEVAYPDLVADPTRVVEKLAAFLGDRFTPSPEVLACVKPQLHRQRGEAPTAR